MIFRRRAKADDPVDIDESDQKAASAGVRAGGPWDRGETDADAADPTYVDLGGLIVRGNEQLELRLQVDDATGQVAAVLLAGVQSGLELRAFAAPRSAGIWDEVRHDIAAEAARRGGTATELTGPFGPEIKVVVPAQTADGRKATQTSRILGVEGPRWMLRGTYLGRAAEEGPDEVLDRAFRDVIVVRGEAPMAPRAMLTMRMPDQARTSWDERPSDSSAHPAQQ